MSSILGSMSEKQEVRLRSTQRKQLLHIVKTGKRKAREILYAHILLKAAEHWTDEAIAQAFDVSAKTVQRIRERFIREGLETALRERERPGQPTKVTPTQEAMLVALACSQPPAGQRRWTVRLLASEAVERRIVSKLLPETMRQVLKKTNSSPGKSKVGAEPTSPQNS
jgi:transposase